MSVTASLYLGYQSIMPRIQRVELPIPTANLGMVTIAPTIFRQDAPNSMQLSMLAK